ncbi:MAG: hypothetical protein M3478_03780 [Planctomycetota bacterium]|nr:hypothetical protein [Planctomycetota bacterium]
MFVKKAAVLAAILAGSASSAALADHPKYVLKRILRGPRPDQYVLVRTHRPAEGERPYALTGDADARRGHRAVERPTPTHPKGTHGHF